MISLIHSQAAGKYLRYFQQPAQPRLRLVCFPWAGGGANFYRKLCGRIAPDVELIAVQLPGREDRFHEPRLTRMELIVAQVKRELSALADIPSLLFGHSMGALVAYEVAQALGGAGRFPLAGLILSGSNAPHIKSCHSRCPHDASEGEVITDISSLGGTPPALLADESLMRSLLPSIRADYAVLEAYRAHPPMPLLDCPVIACAARGDQCISRAGIDAWGQYAGLVFETHWFEGDHFYLTEPQHPWVEQLNLWLHQELAPDACII